MIYLYLYIFYYHELHTLQIWTLISRTGWWHHCFQAEQLHRWIELQL